MLFHEEKYLIQTDRERARGRSDWPEDPLIDILEGYWDLLDVVLDVKARCYRQRDIACVDIVREDDLTTLCSSLQRLRVQIIRYWGFVMLEIENPPGDIMIGYLVKFLKGNGLREFRLENDVPRCFARLIAVDVNDDEIVWEAVNFGFFCEEDGGWDIGDELNERQREACTQVTKIFGPGVVQLAEDDGETVGYDYWADAVEPISASPPDPAPSQNTPATTFLSRINATVRYYPFS
jgi:hypothetical protein